MTTATATRYEISVEDIEYLRHGDKPLLARVYRPRGAGPFPAHRGPARRCLVQQGPHERCGN